MTLDVDDVNDIWKQEVDILRKRKRVAAYIGLNGPTAWVRAWTQVGHSVWIWPTKFILRQDFDPSWFLSELQNREQDEIQSAYFGHKSFSLFVACVNYNRSEDFELKMMPQRRALSSNLFPLSQQTSRRHFINNHLVPWCAAQFRSRMNRIFWSTYTGILLSSGILMKLIITDGRNRRYPK